MTEPASIATLDVTRESCPMTFVRTRLALDRLAPGTNLQVRVRGTEPLRSVSASATALGHAVAAGPTDAAGETLLTITRR